MSQPVTETREFKTENIVANKSESHDLTMAVAISPPFDFEIWLQRYSLIPQCGGGWESKISLKSGVTVSALM